MKNMNQMMNQMKKMKEQMDQAQQELENKQVVGSAGGGVVEVTLNGHKRMLSVKIDPEAVDTDDLEMLQDMIVAAYNDADKQATELMSKDLGKFTSGMNIPGLF